MAEAAIEERCCGKEGGKCVEERKPSLRSGSDAGAFGFKSSEAASEGVDAGIVEAITDGGLW